MDETPAYFPVVPSHLSRVLDEIGLNALTVKRRRNTYLYREQLQNTLTHLNGMNGEDLNSYFHFGSQTEGTTTPGLSSDLDTLLCNADINVIESWAQWQPNTMNLLMLQEDTAPGYCRLQLLRSDVPLAAEDLPDDYYTYDDRGRVILLNTIFYQQILGAVRNGPAATKSGGLFSLYDSDYVPACRCSAWPEQAGEFIRRRRRHSWPSPRLIQQSIKHGVFFVPVGHKLSQTEHLEWRISPSMAERCLMFSLGMVHIKCYVVLKMLVKTFFQPYVGKCISSYHCKTALLYCTENTEPGFWRDDNLLQCVTWCLVTLRTWVNDRFCPQFLISNENLFVGKVTAQNRDVLKSILTYLVKSKGRALLRVEIDDINGLLKNKLTSEPSMVPVMDSEQIVWLMWQFECFMHHEMDKYTRKYLAERNKAAPFPSMRCVCEHLETLRARARCYDKHERHAIQTYITILSGWLGSMMASFQLSRKRPLPCKAITLLHRAAKCDVTSVLKLASVFYSNGDLHKAAVMLNRTKNHFCINKVQQICTCYDHFQLYNIYVGRAMHALQGRKSRSAHVAHCVRFSLQEIHCAPPAVRYELYRAAGDDVQHRDPRNYAWMCLGVVDCLPFLFYLQYLTYTRLGERELCQISLRSLGMCVKKDMFIVHLETAWNLLGQCMEMEDDHDAALQCYITSLEVRPRNNAANWHVAILCYTQLQKRGLLK